MNHHKDVSCAKIDAAEVKQGKVKEVLSETEK